MNPDLGLFPSRSAMSREVWEARSASCAQRILAGTGAASVVVYREEPAYALTSVAHGLTLDGSFVIATTEELPEGYENRVMDVRVSIDKKAPDPAVEVMASSLHFLGEAEWLTPEERAEAIASGFLPECVAEVAAVRGGNLAVVRADKILLHDCGGATPLAYDRAIEQGVDGEYSVNPSDFFTSPEGELFALDTLKSYGECAPAHLCDSLMMGLLPGAMLAKQPVRLSCEHAEAAVLCIDVDRTGLTLMHVGREEAATFFLPFFTTARTASELEKEMERLFEMGFEACK